MALRAIAQRERTYLRKPIESDCAEFIGRVQASRTHLEPWVFPADTQPTFRQWLLRGRRDDIQQFLVCTSDDAIAGFVNLNNIVRGGLLQASAGWASFEPHIAKGHLTDGLEMTLEVAFTQLRLHRIEANVQPGNDRSRTLAARCGFRLEGFSPRYLMVGGAWRDHERWATDVETWRSQR